MCPNNGMLPLMLRATKCPMAHSATLPEIGRRCDPNYIRIGLCLMTEIISV